MAKKIKVGDVRDGSIFVSAVIDAKSFDRNKSYIDYARSGADGAKIIFGGEYDNSKGYFIQPTLIQVTDINSKLLKNEIFGPIVTAYVYPDKEADSLVYRIKDMTPYGLTGAVFSQDKKFLETARDAMRDAVGNYYENDKVISLISLYIILF